MNARKSIETDMERFKALERDAKTNRARGTEGTRLDPKEQAKADIREWVNDTIDTLKAKVRGGGALRGSLQLSRRRPGGRHAVLRAATVAAACCGRLLVHLCNAFGCYPAPCYPQGH